jgi:hypothetical protein
MERRIGGWFAAITLLAAISISGQEKNIRQLSDDKLLEHLSSKKAKVANEAVVEILRRGEKMISILLARKGDRRLFFGTLPADPNFATEFHRPTNKPSVDNPLLQRGKLVTVEVAAIYLICAIYYDSIDIAGSPYLTDLSLPEERQRAANTDEVVAKAWAGLAIWSKKLNARGLRQLRAERDAPLDKAGVNFW